MGAGSYAGEGRRLFDESVPLTRLRLVETMETTIDGVSVAMVHDSGARAGRERRLHRRFPGADLVVFGHSHQPLSADGVDGQRLLNPGSPPGNVGLAPTSWPPLRSTTATSNRWS